jgi:Caspase domain
MSLEEAERAIPAVVRMISGCEDKQTSADGTYVKRDLPSLPLFFLHSPTQATHPPHHLPHSYRTSPHSTSVSNVGSFKLPDPAGRAGGALTACLLSVTYDDHQNTGKDLTFKETLLAVREKLRGKGFDQIPQLSGSRPFDLSHKFDIVPDDFSGTRRAVMIGINYKGDDPGELSGCQNDVHNMKNYLIDCHGFTDDNIQLLLDDGEHTEPTFANIMNAFKQMAAEAQPGDALFVHYSGHGCSISDDDRNEEADNKDEALCVSKKKLFYFGMELFSSDQYSQIFIFSRFPSLKQ